MSKEKPKNPKNLILLTGKLERKNDFQDSDEKGDPVKSIEIEFVNNGYVVSINFEETEDVMASKESFVFPKKEELLEMLNNIFG